MDQDTLETHHQHRHIKAESSKRTPVIYQLLDHSGQVFYVGKTIDPANRLNQHKSTFGANISLEIVQQEFVNETPEDAERIWVQKYVRNGIELRNRVLIRPVIPVVEADEPYNPDFDMTTIPDDVLYAEAARRRSMARTYSIEPVSDPELAAKREKKREQMRKYRASAAKWQKG